MSLWYQDIGCGICEYCLGLYQVAHATIAEDEFGQTATVERSVEQPHLIQDFLLEVNAYAMYSNLSFLTPREEHRKRAK